jgi:hypothetical protein
MSDTPSPKLDDEAKKNIAEAQAAMAELVKRMPRDFGYADELSPTFKAGQ